MAFSRFRNAGQTYMHSAPLPFDDVSVKARPVPAIQDSVKSDFGYGSLINGYYGGTVGRSGELSYDKYGAAMAYCTVPDVNRAVDLLCNAIDSLPFKLIYNETDDKKNDQTIAESTDPRPRHKLIEAFRDVNNENTQSFMWESMYSLLVFGENFIEPLYGKYSLKCTGLNMLNALGVQVIVAGGRIIKFMYTLPGGGGTEPFEEWELVYDKTKNPFDKFRGLSKVAVTMTKVNILRDIDRFLRDYFQNNAVPDMTVAPKGENKFSDTDMLRLRDQVRNQLKGAGNQHRVFISPAAADYTTLDQADLDKQYTVNDPLTRAVYRTFGIPLSMAGDDAGTQYKAGDPVRVGFYQNTIIPAAHDIAKFVTNQIVPLFDDTGCVRLEFDTSEFDQISEDDSLRSTVANANYTGRIWKLDEARTYTKKDAIGGVEGNAFAEAPAPQSPLPFDTPSPVPTEPAALPVPSDTDLQNEFAQALTGGKTVEIKPIVVTSDEPQLVVDAIRNAVAQVIPGKATQSTVEDELRAWERKALKNWRSLFEVVHLKGFIGSLLQELIADSQGNLDTVKSAFAQARDILADNAKWTDERLNIAYETLRSIKAYSDTREQFIDEMVKVIGAGQADETTRRKFAGEMRAALRRYGLLAFRDGMQEVGYDPESLSQKELKRFRDWQDEQSGYVTNLGAEVFKVGITENEVAIRARMWANNSLQAIRLQGVAAGKGTQRLKWRLGTVENHCPDCLTLDGQVHTADEWEAKGIRPGNGRTVCKQGCDCSMELTDDKTSGNWLKALDLETVLASDEEPKGKVRPDRFQFEEYEIANPDDGQKAFDESKHPRADDGKFGEGSGSSEGEGADTEEQGDHQYRDFGSFPETMVSDSIQPGAAKPTDKQHEAMEYYRDISGNADLNRNLRTGKPLSEEGEKHAKQLDSLLNESKLEHDTMVYRGIAPSNPQMKVFEDQIKSGKLKAGSVLTDKGYASTTLDSGVANGTFAEDGGVVFKIKAPKGSNGLYMNAASDKYMGSRYDGEFRDEKEVLLPRDSQYKVHKIEKQGNQYVVEMTYQGVGAGV